VLTQGDASFETIKAEPELIQLELRSSGSLFIFSLVDRSIDLHRLVVNLNAMLETGQVPVLKPNVATAPSKIGEFAKQLASIFEAATTTKVQPRAVLTVDNIMDSVGGDDLAVLQQHFPEGYAATKQDLRAIVASPYFRQATAILESIMDAESAAPAFLAQFGLLEHAGDYPVGFAALLRALQAKIKSETN
jgi:hypothetical protein